MFWETISALIFLVVLSPLWFPLSIAWGVVKFFLSLVVNTISALNAYDVSSALGMGLVSAVISGFDGCLDIPVWMWDWAKFSHPWWALLISFFAVGVMSSRT